MVKDVPAELNIFGGTQGRGGLKQDYSVPTTVLRVSPFEPVENRVDDRDGIAGEFRRAKERNGHTPTFGFCCNFRRVSVDNQPRVGKSGEPLKTTRGFYRSRDET